MSRNRLVTHLSILGTLPTVAVYALAGATGEVHLPQSGSATVSARRGGSEASVKIHTTRVDSGSDLFPLDAEWGIPAVTMVRSIDISVSGYALFVPRSVFSDLTDPHTASVIAQGGLFILTITGGDGGDSYFVRIYFDSKRVRRRSLYSAIPPPALMQDTQYRESAL